MTGHRRWTVVVPVRDPKTGKSRLGATAELTAAIALDTLSAAAACTRIERIVMVTDSAAWTLSLALPSAIEIFVEPTSGLVPAVHAGVGHAGATPTAVLLGDLPALRPVDLDDALQLAAEHPLGMVADHRGDGTTLITALPEAVHAPRFGPGSAARHRAAGYAELPVPADSTVRCDVDMPEDLSAAERLGLGPATRAALQPGTPPRPPSPAVVAP